jgi:ribosomal-protein-alanine N-acetyltransferase
MQFLFRPLCKNDIEQVATWRYEAPYAIYNGITLKTGLSGFLRLRPLFRWLGFDCLAVDDETGQLAGIFQFSKEPRRAITIGLAMRPDLTGHGYGQAFVEAGLAYARQHFHPKTFRLTVATFNERARKVYERVGFRTLKKSTQFTAAGREYVYHMERSEITEIKT